MNNQQSENEHFTIYLVAKTHEQLDLKRFP